ncbi:hypothetical protein ACFO4O_11725 [Glaciecola siphonariae]|uniref:PEP-CTERM protein-sorting domain-containing protein n=1 Tax=Glaciecola siphonariae TaxID=521012 RepID=A0ABV9LY80_9ALTE
MLKQAMIGMSLLAASSFANAALIVSQSAITGADMAGMEVTVTFADSTSESVLWTVVNGTPGTGGTAIENAEAQSGGAFADTWALTQAGFTLGGVQNGIFFGDWELTNLSAQQAIIGLSINGWLGNGGIAFDSIASNTDEGTPGSGSGQAFISNLPASGQYFLQVDPAYDDLFWQLGIVFNTGLNAQDSISFFADTELLAEVSAPATIGLVLGSLVLFARRSRASVKSTVNA